MQIWRQKMPPKSLPSFACLSLSLQIWQNASVKNAILCVFVFFHLHHQHLHAVCYAFSRGSLFQSVTATENDNGAKIGKFFFCRMHSKTKICVTRSLRTQLLVSIAEIYTLEKTKSRFHKNITLDFHKWCFTKVRNLHSLSLFPKTVSSSFEQTILFNKDCWFRCIKYWHKSTTVLLILSIIHYLVI